MLNVEVDDVIPRSVFSIYCWAHYFKSAAYSRLVQFVGARPEGEDLRAGLLFVRLLGHGAQRDAQRGLGDPVPLVGGAVPALHGDAVHAGAFIRLQDFRERRGVAGPDLRGRAAEKDQALRTVLEDSQGAPALQLGFGLIDLHGTLLGREKGLGVRDQRSEVRSRTSDF